nr:type II toxin-antitoxin system Phd/YefM family antitoxin [Ruminococcus bromii]
MINTNVTNFRQQIFELIDQTVKYNEPIKISTKSGNAVLISEEDYNNLVETMYLNSIPGMSEKLKDGIETPLEECEEFEW